MKTIGIIIAIILAVFLVVLVQKSHESDIKDWAKSKGMEVKTIEMHITAIGSPFYYVHKGQYIYEVHMTNGELWWARTGIFGNEYEQQDK